MIAASQALSALPAGLRDPLLKEYETIVQNYLEQRWGFNVNYAPSQVPV
jgi:hypothetical protein